MSRGRGSSKSTMASIRMSIGIFAALALAACASDLRPHRAAPPPPGPGPGLSQPQAPAGGAPPSRSASESAQTGESWRKSGASRAQQRADTEDCYSYAWAQVDNDIRIDNDIAAARGQDFTGQAEVLGLTRRVDDFYYKRQRSVLFEDCMNDKGYSRI